VVSRGSTTNGFTILRCRTRSAADKMLALLASLPLTAGVRLREDDVIAMTTPRLQSDNPNYRGA